MQGRIARHAVVFNDTATPEIYTLSLHDALPIFTATDHDDVLVAEEEPVTGGTGRDAAAEQPPLVLQAQVPVLRAGGHRSEEHTSELQSRQYLVCRLLLEKKNRTVRRPSRRSITT